MRGVRLNLAPVTVNILGLKVNAMDHSSVLNMGPSQHLDIFVSYKRNLGIGEQNGDLTSTICSVSGVFDCDLFDGNSVKNSLL